YCTPALASPNFTESVRRYPCASAGTYRPLALAKEDSNGVGAAGAFDASCPLVTPSGANATSTTTVIRAVRMVGPRSEKTPSIGALPRTPAPVGADATWPEGSAIASR